MMDHEQRAAKFGIHFQPDADWLATAPAEDLLDPELPIIDTHHHLREVKPKGKNPGRRYLLDEYAADVASGHNVVASVYVEGHSSWRKDGPQAFRSVGEVEFANGIAAQSASGQYGPARVAAAIVGHVDLRGGDTAARVLDACIAAGNGRLRGIRHSGHWDDDPGVRNGQEVQGPGLLCQPDYLAGAAQVAARGLTVEAWVYYMQLQDVCALADALPQGRIVLNHLGGPLGLGGHALRPDEVFASWRKWMAEVARRDNVVVKISGLTNRMRNYMGRPQPPGSRELADDWRGYVENTVELFGAHRCMLASSFPVDKQGATWNAHWNAYKRILANASADEKRLIFHDTAAKVYGLVPMA